MDLSLITKQYEKVTDLFERFWIWRQQIGHRLYQHSLIWDDVFVIGTKMSKWKIKI